MNDNGYLFSEPAATMFDDMRAEARTKRHISYDCYNAVVKGDRVRCKLGYQIGSRRDGGMTLLQVLRGRSCRVCQDCVDYNGGE